MRARVCVCRCVVGVTSKNGLRTHSLYSQIVGVFVERAVVRWPVAGTLATPIRIANAVGEGVSLHVVL